MTWPGIWPSHPLAESNRRLQELRDELANLDEISVAVEQAMARFLVVRACGHIEFTFEEAFCSYAEAKAIPAVAAFVRSQFFRGSNPRADRLTEILQRMDPARAQRFVDYIDSDDQRIRRELSFLIDRRNRIAHGQNETVSRRKALDLADLALNVGQWITTEIDPRS
jgi:hypothetical protein